VIVFTGEKSLICKSVDIKAMIISIINYNMGNIKSVENAFKRIGADVLVTGRPADLDKASGIVLPGVGAFSDAVGNLEKSGMDKKIIENTRSKKPFLGICIGLQVLFEYGMEGGKNMGLGILKGNVEKIPAGVKIPHMGWNKIKILKRDSRLFQGIEDKESFYFVHSYHVVCRDKGVISSTTDYGIDIASSVESSNIYGLQFHPEKSSLSGLKILSNFVKICS
jgi:glutamine amidotransferase